MEGGHEELVLNLISNIESVIEHPIITRGIFQLSNKAVHSIINLNPRKIVLVENEIFGGLIMSDNLAVMIELLKTYKCTISDVKITNKTYKTIEYLLNNDLLNLGNLDFIRIIKDIIKNGSVQLFELIASHYRQYFVYHCKYYHEVYTKCIDYNRWDIIQILPNLLPFPKGNSNVGHRLILEANLFLSNQNYLRSMGYRKTLNRIYQLS